MEAVLSVQSINKHYPGFALENVSFSLAPNRDVYKRQTIPNPESPA